MRNGTGHTEPLVSTVGVELILYGGDTTPPDSIFLGSSIRDIKVLEPEIQL